MAKGISFVHMLLFILVSTGVLLENVVSYSVDSSENLGYMGSEYDNKAVSLDGASGENFGGDVKSEMELYAEPFKCTQAGKWPDPTTCYKYHSCHPLNDGLFVDVTMPCPEGSSFCPEFQLCFIQPFCPCSISTDPTSSTDYDDGETTETTAVTEAPIFQCSAPGYYGDLNSDCSKYYYCSPLGSNFLSLTLTCSEGKTFCGTSQYGQCLDEGTCICGEDYVVTTTTTSTTTAVTEPFKCTQAGKWPDPTSCYKYHSCYPLSDGLFVDVTMPCPEGSSFCPEFQLCFIQPFCPCGETSESTSSLSTDSTTTTSPIPTPPPFRCSATGYWPEIVDDGNGILSCNKYHYCSPLGSNFVDIKVTCSPGQQFCGTNQKGACYSEGSCDCGGPLFTTTTETTAVTEAPIFQCSAPGYYGDLNSDCSKYYYCSPMGSNFISLTLACSEGKTFCGTSQYGQCLDEGTCVCGEDYVATTTTTTATTTTTTTTSTSTSTSTSTPTTTTTTTTTTAISTEKPIDRTTPEEIQETTNADTRTSTTDEGGEGQTPETTPSSSTFLSSSTFTILIAALISIFKFSN